MTLIVHDDWPPVACTMPSVEQPLIRAEFDDFFAKDVRTVDQTTQRGVRLDLRAEPDVAARAASLVVKETGCCSFFSFDLAITEGSVVLVVSTAPGHDDVLAALAAHAQTRGGGNS